MIFTGHCFTWRSKKNATNEIEGPPLRICFDFLFPLCLDAVNSSTFCWKWPKWIPCMSKIHIAIKYVIFNTKRRWRVGANNIFSWNRCWRYLTCFSCAGTKEPFCWTSWCIRKDQKIWPASEDAANFSVMLWRLHLWPKRWSSEKTASRIMPQLLIIYFSCKCISRSP